MKNWVATGAAPVYTDATGILYRRSTVYTGAEGILYRYIYKDEAKLAKR
jgi:hypothetical protein